MNLHIFSRRTALPHFSDALDFEHERHGFVRAHVEQSAPWVWTKPTLQIRTHVTYHTMRPPGNPEVLVACDEDA